MNDNPRPRITHPDWMELAAEEYRRLDALLGALTTAEWAAPTDCAGWTVRDIVAHLLGAAEATASVREQMRQQRIGKARKGAGAQIDAVNDLQIRERAGLTTDQLVDRLRAAGQRGLRARTRIPAPIRALRMPFPPPLRWAPLGFLTDVVYTRDAWMHRVDICRATGRRPHLTADHDGRIIAHAATAWQRAANAPCLVLTGPVGLELGGSDVDATDSRTHDAVDFARALSGRGAIPGVRPDLVLF